MEKNTEMIFRKDRVEMCYDVETPFGIERIVKKINYEDLRDTLTDEMMPCVIEDIYPIIEEDILKGLKFEIGFFGETGKIPEKGEKRIEIELTRSSCDYKLIDVPRRFRRLFPGYKVPFIMETNAGELETYIVGASAAKEGNQMGGTYISKGMRRDGLEVILISNQAIR